MSRALFETPHFRLRVPVPADVDGMWRPSIGLLPRDAFLYAKVSGGS